MKTLKSVFILFIISFKAYCFVPIETVYQGTIGNYPIVMLLDSFDDDKEKSYAGTYFYRKQKKDIHLSGIIEKGTIVLKVLDSEGKAKEIFSLKMSDNTFQGTWESGTKILNVTLKKITDVDNIKHNFAHLPSIQKAKKEKLFYSYIRTSDVILNKVDSVSSFMNHQLSWVTDGKSGIYFFRVDNGYSEKMLKQINTFLEETQLENLEAFYSCTTSWGVDGEYELTLYPTFMSKNYFSFYYSMNNYCGGNHPNYFNVNYTFDVVDNLKRLSLEDFLYFKQGNPPKEDSDEWNKYRNDVFVPKLIEILKNKYPKEMQVNGDCDPSEFWNSCNWHLTNEGLSLENDPPNVALACGVGFLIPYETMSKYGKGKYPFPKTK